MTYHHFPSDWVFFFGGWGHTVDTHTDIGSGMDADGWRTDKHKGGEDGHTHKWVWGGHKQKKKSEVR